MQFDWSAKLIKQLPLFREAPLYIINSTSLALRNLVGKLQQAAEQKCSRLKIAPPDNGAPRPSASAPLSDSKARYPGLPGGAVPKGRAFGKSLHTFFLQESMGPPRPEGQCGD